MKVKGKRIIHSSGGDIDMGDVELEDFIMPEAKEVKDRWFEGIRMVEGWEAKSRKLRGIFSKMGYENITAVALLNVVVPIGYRHDELAIRSADFWFFPIETLSRGVGDCLTGDTKIITLRDGKYHIESLDELKNGWKGVKVLSYNFNKRNWAFRPIINFVDKGVKDVYEVSLRNGTSFRVSDEHKMYVARYICKTRQKEIGVMHLSDLRQKLNSIKSKHLYQLVEARKIPALGTVDVDSRELYIEGHYVAEGWCSGSRVATSGKGSYKVMKFLDELGIPYRLKFNSNGVPEVFIKKSYLKERLRRMGHNAFDKHFLNDRLSLSKEGIKELLEGYIDGDGYRNPKRNLPRGEGRQESVEVIYNTSSDELAKQLAFLNKILGKYTYQWYQVNHRGSGKRPIWRLYVYNDKRRVWKPITPHLSNIAIKNIEYQGRERVYDITVADTHNFVLDNGLLIHNCEDTTFLLSSLYSFDPMVSNRYWACLGYYRQNGRLYGHAFVLFNNSYFERMNYGRWVVMETTLERPMSPFLQLTWTGEDSNWIPAMIFRKGWEGYYKFEFYSLDDPKGREILGLGDGWFRKYERYIDEMKEYVLGGKLMKRKWMHKTKRPPVRSFTMPEMKRALMRKRSRA